ncbi:DUF6325 family protein [Ornithinimicrobium sp. F0845]|uniref:DUF6325 family protein n=1 Tax=Ornithinimicrobium sp. F0845 TaxID=2926412 RepID=UPI001FF27A1B|nr:DUF6325 family protein [Ornithinimicrobium sp. F0845]MCK0113577.1 DUF6325 family protein [Ornithinimicrobium sp. F0845]
MDTVVGPVELVVLAFPGSKFKGEIIPAVGELVDSGVVSLLDVALVTKDDAGDTLAIELADLDDELRGAFDTLDGEVSGLLSDEDLGLVAEGLDPGTTAAVILWENTWARGLVSAIQGAGGVLVAHERMDAARAAEAIASLDNEEE